MLMHNEAVRTRDPLGLLPYSPEKVDKTLAGDDPVMYPTNDWYVELLKDYTENKRMNFSVNGGGKVARYYVSIAGSQDNGIRSEEQTYEIQSLMSTSYAVYS